MKLKSYYLDEFIDLVEEEYGYRLELNDDTGKYQANHVPLIVNSWNYKVECKRNYNYDLNKLIKIFIKTNENWYEDGSEEN